MLVCVLVGVGGLLVCVFASGGSPEGTRSDPCTITNALIGEQVRSTFRRDRQSCIFPKPGERGRGLPRNAAGLLELTKTLHPRSYIDMKEIAILPWPCLGGQE